MKREANLGILHMKKGGGTGTAHTKIYAKCELPAALLGGKGWNGREREGLTLLAIATKKIKQQSPESVLT